MLTKEKKTVNKSPLSTTAQVNHLKGYGLVRV